MWSYLSSHPNVAPAVSQDDVYIKYPDGRVLLYCKSGVPIKETRFFTLLYDDYSREFYESLFDPDMVGIDASVENFHIEKNAYLIKKCYPDKLKFIVMLRDPAERAWSQYWHEVNYNKTEKLPFLDAINRKLSTLEDWYFRAYLQTGHYAEHLKRWFSLFGRDKFFIIQSENFFQNPDLWFKKTQFFLGLQPIVGIADYENASATTKHPKMGHGIKKKLDEYFRPYNEELYRLIN